MATTVRVDAFEFMRTSIANNLRRLREEAGLSQSEVARKAKIRPEVLCRLEAGHGNPTVATVAKIVKAIERLSA